MDKKFHFSTVQDKFKNSTKSSMRLVGTTRYGLISLFGKSKHGSTLVSNLLHYFRFGFAQGQAKIYAWGCVGTHKTPILCADMSSKYIK
jgi:hypothetical protein